MSTLARRYRLISEVGCGGMASVWRAKDERLGRTVAVKMLLPELAASASARGRAEAEALTTAVINHPNVAAVYDSGRRRIGLCRSLPYLVMEFVDGESLDHRLGGPDTLPWQRTARIAVQVADALNAAHLYRVVHRDIKPGNIMLTTAGVKVIDFGMAAITGVFLPGPAGVLLGTPEYMAPEQVRGEPVTVAADMYAFGLVLYQMLTGRLPWTEATRHGLLRQRREAPTVRLPPMTEVPAGIVDLCDRCLSNDPERRPSSRTAAGVLREALSSYTEDREPAAATMPGQSVAQSYCRPQTQRRARIVPWRTAAGRRPAVLRRSVAAAAAAALIAVIGWVHPLWGSPALPSGGSVGSGECAIHYTGRRDGGSFTAEISVSATSAPPWRLRFAVPPGQRIERLRGGPWSQEGTQVTLSGNEALNGGAPARLRLAGAIERAEAGTPAGFELNGVACRQSVSVVTVVRPTDA